MCPHIFLKLTFKILKIQQDLPWLDEQNRMIYVLSHLQIIISISCRIFHQKSHINTPYIENVKENMKYVEVQVCPVFYCTQQRYSFLYRRKSKQTKKTPATRFHSSTSSKRWKKKSMLWLQCSSALHTVTCCLDKGTRVVGILRYSNLLIISRSCKALTWTTILASFCNPSLM